ncbi:Glucoamylase (glucan-1,4-alpha-glucosidase), GH15 family [Luteibacter sp. UNC138MFCol5.1]|uniref:glycoside hydrolase family 15 protein n=1 Tax=Luteibacter sp. UNC138MFCol5.1 TaxID=1502774 RepID=UPI0008B2D4EA|nr:glycoside hydrolase family 15 protein [Luteibacter sp. UNC138MFCol5.1]SEP12330.1 Glucoamylase (glucan-1,4-alpha-glucosidase), GH15 family [Luteibacter sp. UNC138MFCol5.1]
MASRIEDYAMLGNCRSAALVARNGSIDWACLPRFDSASCFSALIGEDANGRWRIAPADADAMNTRQYIDGSLVLETVWSTATGRARVVDFMPFEGEQVGIVRIVEGIEGCVDFEVVLTIRFDYGNAVPWVKRVDDETMTAVAGPDLLVVRSPVALEGEGMHSVARFSVREGETVPFALAWGPSHLPPPPTTDAHVALRDSLAFWERWSGRCNDSGEWSDIVRRSLVVLKGLSYLPTGGIVAAPTTSLPEQLGGQRNWDYRFCWARDATFVLSALVNAGYHDEASAWRDWVRRAVAGSPDQLQVLYGLAGERRLEEFEVPWLAGYEGAKPVRIGNAASMQFQLDIYGELVGAFAHAIRHGVTLQPEADEVQAVFLEHLERIWREPDEGIWEIRGEPRHFVHSKVMAWLAFQRAAEQDRHGRDPAFTYRWRAVADEIRADILAKGVDPERGCFTQSYGSKELDASLLLVTLTDFLPPDDPRIAATVRAIEEDLLVQGFVRRYDTRSGVDGLPPGEGEFLPCSFWLVENYVLLGRLDEARELFVRLIGLSNDLGLLAEEYDPRSKRLLGNFPQAFSHVALVNAAFSLAHGYSATADSHATPEAIDPQGVRA